MPNRRPLNGLAYFSAAETTILHTAEEIEVRTCMNGRGFDYRLVPDRDHTRPAAASPYSLLLPDRAKADGYGMTGAVIEAQRSQARDPNEPILAGNPPAFHARWQAALTGTGQHREKIQTPDGTNVYYSTDGCVHIAREKLYGPGWDRRYYEIQGLSNQILHSVEKSQRYSAALGAWRACMGKADLPYSNLEEVRRTIRQQLAEAPNSDQLTVIGQLELKLAGQDLACQREARLHEAVRTSQVEAEDAILSTRRTAIEQFSVQRAGAISRATAIARPCSGRSGESPNC